MFRRRRSILTLLVVGLAPAFLATHSLVNTARARRQQIAVDWARRGDRDLAAGRAADAADDYRTAQDYARERGLYRRQLAEALVAADRLPEAKSQLLTLWTSAPGDGQVNLELARVSTREGNAAEAVRYYHAAIDGAWPENAAVSRRNARRELALFLLSRGAGTQAQAELIALVGDLPADAAQLTDAAALLLRAGASTRALTVLRQALQIDGGNARALRLAGQAAYQLGDYRTARDDLRAAANAADLDVPGAGMLEVSARILDLDPFAAHISSRERLRRVVRAYEVASAALDACPAASPGDDLRARVDASRESVTERRLAADPDLVDETLALAGDIESAVRAACGPGSGDQLALGLILQQRRPAA